MAWWFAAYAALVIVGTLNRETTGILLWLSFFAAYPRAWQRWLLLGLILACVLLGLRWYIDAEPTIFTPQWVFAANLETWRLQGAILYQGLLLPLWILLYHRMRGKTGLMVACVLIPYLLLFATFGVWQEVRLMMPVLILGIPFARSVFNDR